MLRKQGGCRRTWTGCESGQSSGKCNTVQQSVHFRSVHKVMHFSKRNKDVDYFLNADKI